MDLGRWADLAEIASLATILVAAAFTMYQVRESRLARREDATFKVVMRFMEDAAWVSAFRHLSSLPAGWQAGGLDAVTRSHADHAYMTLEIMGFAVHKGAVTAADVEALMGGVIRDMWDLLRPLAERERAQHPRAYEWSERLVAAIDQAKRARA